MAESAARDIYRHTGRRSYELLEASERFLESHGPISTNQAHGLENVINCEPKNINSVLGYVMHQGSKSTSRDTGFWKDLKSELDGLRKQAKEIQEELGVEAPASKAAKEQLALIHLALARDYVQHLAAHNEYRRAITGGR